MAVSAAELAGLKHRIGDWAIVPPGRNHSKEPGVVTVAVRILDARSIYGRVDVLIEPVYGAGEMWVNLKKVQLRTR